MLSKNLLNSKTSYHLRLNMPINESERQDIKINHNGNISQNVNDSKDVILLGNISGKENIVNINATNKSNYFEIGVDEISNMYMLLGRKLLEVLGIKKFYYSLFIPIIVSGYTFVDFFTIKLLPQSIYFTVFGLLLFIFALNMYNLSNTRTCVKCKRKFALRQLKAKHLRSGVYRGKIYHNIEIQYKCDFCGHEVVRKIIDPEEITKN